jgi:hypothetical protein
MSSINVKVSTQKLIESLESALAVREAAQADYDKKHKQYEAEKAKFDKELISLIGTKKLSLVSTRVYRNYRSDKSCVDFEFTLSGDVKIPEAPDHLMPRATCEIEEIRNAIALLRLSDSETVSTSTYKGVARYL